MVACLRSRTGGHRCFAAVLGIKDANPWHINQTLPLTACFSSSGHAGAAGSAEHLSALASSAASAGGMFAASPMEPALSELLNPVLLSSGLWEWVHSATGLPWWASIPLTTLGLRAALLPLTLKAKSAALNWVLLQNSYGTATRLLEQMEAAHRDGKGAHSAAGSGATSQVGEAQRAPLIAGAGRSNETPLKRPSKLKLVRMYYHYFRKQHKTTSMWWWLASTGVQVRPSWP